MKNRAPGEKTVFSDLFERTFVPVFSWGTQNLKLLMPVLQCNIVRQMLLILEGLVPVKKEDEQAVSMSSKDSQDGKLYFITFPGKYFVVLGFQLVFDLLYLNELSNVFS